MNDKNGLTAEQQPLHMFRAELDIPGLHRWMGRRGLRDYGQAMHCLITEGMGRLAPRSHRASTHSRQQRRGSIIGYTHADAARLEEELQACADPGQYRIIIPGSMESKQMPQEWAEGRRLGFEVKLRPIVRLNRNTSQVSQDILPGFLDGRLKPRSECDVHTWECVRSDTRGEPPPLREEVYARWLADKFEKQGGCQADPGEMALVDYHQVALAFRGQRGLSPGPDVLIRGILQVADPQQFGQLVAQGIGRFRAYGYGMLLLKPAMPVQR